MNIYTTTALGLLIPFIGTSAGSACVFFMKDKLKDKVQKDVHVNIYGKD